GYGVVHFKKSTRDVTFECYKRFTDVKTDKKDAQFPGWPIKFNTRENDGRKVYAKLPRFAVKEYDHPVYQVIEDATGEILYTTRSGARTIEASVYGPGKYTVKAGKDKPEIVVLESFEVKAK
ncbi:MAG: hypothetical protein VCA35_10760, partial [Roseibacillus sp.]